MLHHRHRFLEMPDRSENPEVSIRRFCSGDARGWYVRVGEDECLVITEVRLEGRWIRNEQR